MRRFSEEVKSYIADNVSGTTTKDLVKMVNEKFDLNFTESSMRSFKTNNGLKSGTPLGKPSGMGGNVFPLEVREFILKNLNGVGPKEMADLLNKAFNKDYKASQIKSYYANNKLNSGLSGRFVKGNVPQNKGKKGQYAPGCEKGWFRNGQMPVNHRPVGSERIDSKDGYRFVKTAEPNVWELKHKVLYESVFGKLPEGYVVTFLDGDKTNIKIENLEAITMAESLELTRSKLRFNNSDLTKTGILIVKVKQAKTNLRKTKQVVK